MTALTDRQVAAAAYRAGFRGDALVMIVGISWRESRHNPDAIGDIDNPRAGCRSYGLVQINVCPDGNNRGIPWRENPRLLLDPDTNMAAAFSMSAGGRQFGPWTTYRAGIPAPDLARVRAALAGYDPATDPGGPVSSTPSSDPAGAGFFGQLAAVNNAAATLASSATWRRVLMVLGGALLLGLGLSIIASDARSITDGARSWLKTPSPDDDDDQADATPTTIMPPGGQQ